MSFVWTQRRDKPRGRGYVMQSGNRTYRVGIIHGDGYVAIVEGPKGGVKAAKDFWTGRQAKQDAMDWCEELATKKRPR